MVHEGFDKLRCSGTDLCELGLEAMLYKALIGSISLACDAAAKVKLASDGNPPKFRFNAK
jgi:hypothetical protein